MGVNKRIDLEEIGSFIQEQDRLWVGGWTVVRKPMAMVYQIIKERKKELHIVNNPGGPGADLLIGAGCVSKTETNYIGHEVFGHPYNFKNKMENREANSDYHHDDWTVGSGMMRIVAGAMGIPFIPTKFLRGSDLLNPEHDGFKDIRGKNPKIPKKKFVTMEDPFWEGEEVMLVPSIRPDVCLVHAQEVSEDGTARISGGAFLDYYAAIASKVTIVSAEKIVPVSHLLKTNGEDVIPGEVVDAIVEVPLGAHPTAVHACYDNDPWWFQGFIQASKNERDMARWYDKWIHSVPSFGAYLDKIGQDRLARLVADPCLGYASDINRRLDKIKEVV